MRLYELTRWLAFPRIQHPRMWVYVWAVPSALTVTCLLGFILSPSKPPVFGDRSISELVYSIFLILPGFFITALAAVATFPNQAMDENLPEVAPKLKFLVDGDVVETDLTMRMVLCYMFSYITILSLIIVVASGIFFKLMTLENVQFFTGALFEPISYITLIFLLFASFSVLVALVHGIFFLSERMQQPN